MYGNNVDPDDGPGQTRIPKQAFIPYTERKKIY
jgi:hypothetical protein